MPDVDVVRQSARQALVESFGFKVSERQPDVKPGHAGAWMVTDPPDGAGGFAVVGDDLSELLLETIELHGLAG